ncbi:hypothetical protein BN2537_16247 [Streptomyces venezuelae]|nr:hypothetical protein BN2537_16247 [Streptomyces venezuelae]
MALDATEGRPGGPCVPLAVFGSQGPCRDRPRWLAYEE